jgi:hypothetical protein
MMKKNAFQSKIYIFTLITIITLSCCTEQTEQKNDPVRIHGVTIEKIKEIEDFGRYYYTGVTCTEDTVYVSFETKGDVYVIPYDTDLNQLAPSIDITSGITKYRQNEGFPDHVLVYAEGYFYGVYHSSWAPEKYGLYLVKYDKTWEIVDQERVGYFGEEYEETAHEFSDSPLIRVHNGTIYVITACHKDTHPITGTVVRVYDENLTLKKTYLFDWDPFGALSAADLIFSDNLYTLITSGGTPGDQESPRKLHLFKFTEEGDLMEKRELIPPEVSDPLGAIYQVTHPHAVHRNNLYYLPFVGAPGPTKTKEREITPVPNLYLGIFDESFTFQRLLKLTSYTEEDYKKICIVPAIYADSIGQYLYAAVGFTSLDEEGKCSPWGRATESLFLIKYRITDADDIVEGVKGPKIPEEYVQ